MGEFTDKSDYKRIKEAQEKDASTKFKVTLKNLELILSKDDYIKLIIARNWLKKQIAKEEKLKDADEVKDAKFYEVVLTKSCDGICTAIQNETMNNLVGGMLNKMLGKAIQDLMGKDAKEDDDDAD